MSCRPPAATLQRLNGTDGPVAHVLGPMTATAAHMNALLQRMTTRVGRMNVTARRMTAIDKARKTGDGVSTEIVALSIVRHLQWSASAGFPIVAVELGSREAALWFALVAP